jgi:predicted kinase
MKSLSLPTPHLIVMVGIPGSGKTYFGEHFAETFHAPYVNAHNIAKQSNIDIGSAHMVSQLVLSELLKTQKAVVFDGLSGARQDRQALSKLAKDAGYTALFIWVQTESIAAKSRSSKRTHHNGGLSDDQFETMIKHFSAPHASEQAVVISGKHTYPSQLKIVLKRLVEPRDNHVKTGISVRTASDRPRLIR